MTIENVYGFGSVGTGSHIYLFGGCKVPSYDDTKENLHEFLPPVQTRGELPLLSSVLYHIDLKEEKIEELHAPKELATAGPTIHITDIDSEGKAERIFIMGGTSKQNILYTKSEFELKKCEIPSEYGHCRLDRKTPTTVTNTCSVCHIKIHSDCDSYKHIHKKKFPNYACPKCKEIGFVSQRPKLKRNK